MTRKEAGAILKSTLTACTEQQAQDINDILEIGAGNIRQPEGVVFSGPKEMPNSRREAYMGLIDTVYDCDPQSGEKEWQPVQAGAWESVLATLVIQGTWETIAKTANQLREEETPEGKAHRVEMRGGR